MMKLALVAAALMAGAAEAATVAVWRGAGPNACHGACPLEWALDQLAEAQREKVLAAMEDGGARPILVHRGDVFEFMTYQRGGTPYVDRRRTVAGMDEPARAWGWRFDGWSFVQLEECGNWAPVVHAERLATLRPAGSPDATPQASSPDPAAPPPFFVAPAGPVALVPPALAEPTSVSTLAPAGGPPPAWTTLVEPSPAVQRPEARPPPPPPAPVATIATPQGAALLLLAFGLAWSRSRRAPSIRSGPARGAPTP